MPRHSLIVTAIAVISFAASAVRAQDSEVAGAEPEVVVKQFLIAMIKGDKEALSQLALPNPELKVLYEGPPVPAVALPIFLKQIEKEAVTRFKVGDEIKLPGGQTIVLSERHINENRVQLNVGNQPIPFPVAKHEGQWRVDARPLIMARKAAAKMLGK